MEQGAAARHQLDMIALHERAAAHYRTNPRQTAQLGVVTGVLVSFFTLTDLSLALEEISQQYEVNGWPYSFPFLDDSARGSPQEPHSEEESLPINPRQLRQMGVVTEILSSYLTAAQLASALEQIEAEYCRRGWTYSYPVSVPPPLPSGPGRLLSRQGGMGRKSLFFDFRGAPPCLM